MTYLLTQMFLYLLVAFLLGLLLGWLIWRYGQPSTSEIDVMRAENSRLRSDLDTCTRKTATLEAQAQAPVAIAAAPAMAVAEAPVSDAKKPEGLSGPRDGVADELQRIHGVGPKMEGMLHNLGYYHFDQIAAWTAAEVAWVDDNLEGFKGRVTRDNWQPQAKVLARG